MTNRAVLERAREVQLRLESFYALEAGPDVTDFVEVAATGEREALLLKEGDQALDVGLVLPAMGRDASMDEGAQLIEGVSHFVYLVERARTELGLTELEIELQAEVDKFVVLAFDGSRLAERRARSVRHSLFHRVTHLYAEDTEQGVRYRLANRLADRLSARLAEGPRAKDARSFLQRFYRLGQTDKIRLARAA